jgi:hypothetical protein
MLLEYLAMPRAGDITTPDVDDSYVWTKDEIPPAEWTLDEDSR